MINDDEWGIIKYEDSRWKSSSGYEKYPAVNITWYGANQYAKWAGKRLPTEAEWEKACRASSNTKYCCGEVESNLVEYAWNGYNSGNKTHPVGQKKPNSYGIYDMIGNAWEWCSDWYDADYYKSSPYKNPQGPDSGSLRVMRGGSWNNFTVMYRSANRYSLDPRFKWNGNSIGFRCARSSAQ
ncbi:hypothetical protein COY52_06170 [Candidatus Desantisbacteria bacterium CG_4_10_14_0_8_um_filter_48_22]|uniref:Sulfatase-modifying factor enzyme-like domain-containing protein n=1 Tax=Candidatus Desantisbacteria bacterium CG_4_10_14_0_8_um_filter_48_22 TaxID=1974543 RepID=A0A2M7SB26_9BACT|nr:MAG: hypothetical protein COY52_06170 [Candidatus Desantisbacteria bacterium CG_4_10_14_0_8_um_filter_48_22]